MTTTTLTLDQLKRAVQIAEKIEALQSELDSLMGSSGTTVSESVTEEKSGAKKGPKKKRTMSPEAKAKIAEAQRRRWAAQKA